MTIICNQTGKKSEVKIADLAKPNGVLSAEDIVIDTNLQLEVDGRPYPVTIISMPLEKTGGKKKTKKQAAKEKKDRLNKERQDAEEDRLAVEKLNREKENRPIKKQARARETLKTNHLQGKRKLDQDEDVEDFGQVCCLLLCLIKCTYIPASIHCLLTFTTNNFSLLLTSLYYHK